ncbi:polysaccharide export protein [Temperatibacter marinus]|uniref:Polysaccharide export protein n=1 Tax=Temperatibacter marinus TaxID=1456591 RepID=A0AA52EFA9_9PROT|nr:XrtA/PEP-CTERM system exopolysaccharide export protein [Temperatibacter marinus]WND02608.1 polysaccharide export protein [Temperatibacter marinus]
MQQMMKIIGMSLIVLALSGCSYFKRAPLLPSAPFVKVDEGPGPEYRVGPLDRLDIYVWQQPELSKEIIVRPDGRFSMPLVPDIPAAGKTSTEIAVYIEEKLSEILQTPIVSVMVADFTGPFAQQVRVVGEASEPKAIAYRANMTLLDLMIEVGGLTEFAAGDRATLVRYENGEMKEYRIKISSLLKDGDVDANVVILPGDVLIIPESIF